MFGIYNLFRPNNVESSIENENKTYAGWNMAFFANCMDRRNIGKGKKIKSCSALLDSNPVYSITSNLHFFALMSESSFTLFIS